MKWTDSTIDTAEAVDSSETTIDVSADPTSLLPNGTVVRVATDDEQMLVTGGSGAVALACGVDTPSLGSSTSGNTVIDVLHAVNASGTITTFKVYINAAGGTLAIGMFYLTAGKYKCRSAASLTAPGGTGLQTYSVSLACQAGDCLGVYYSSNIAYKTGAVSGQTIYKSGNHCSVGDEETYSNNNVFNQYRGEGSVPAYITVTRAYNGSTAAEHSTGADISIGTPSGGNMSKSLRGLVMGAWS